MSLCTLSSEGRDSMWPSRLGCVGKLSKQPVKVQKVGAIGSTVLRLFGAHGERPVYRVPICTHAPSPMTPVTV